MHYEYHLQRKTYKNDKNDFIYFIVNFSQDNNAYKIILAGNMVAKADRLIALHEPGWCNMSVHTIKSRSDPIAILPETELSVILTSQPKTGFVEI